MDFKHLNPDQRIVNAVIGIILLSLIVFSYIFDPSTYKLIDCYFHNLTGHPCPSCGLTRSFYAMAHLQITEAFHLNWMGPVLFLGALILAILLLAEAASGRSIQSQSKIITPIIILMALGSLWLVIWVVRLLVIES